MTSHDSASPGGRRLILCLDGTWNQAEPLPGVAPSNAVRLAGALRERDRDGAPQVLLYLEGLGTAGLYDSTVNGFTGRGIDGKIRHAFTFLAESWRPQDRIYLFGISRGAFAALTVSRLLGRYGLPPEPDASAWELVWPAWLRDENLAGERWIKPPVEILGAWDTVEALGLPVDPLRGWTAPRVGPRGPVLGSTVLRAYHALAYHERRIAFRPTVWQAPFPPGSTVEQRWFRGSHADVCGGFGNPALSDVSLAWMLGHAREAGLAFDEELLARESHPDPDAPMRLIHSGWHRILPLEPRHPGQTSPESETMDAALLRELERKTPTP